MSSQKKEGAPRSTPREPGASTRDTTGGLANSAISTVESAGAEAVSSVSGQVKALLDEKVIDGAEIVGHLADSVFSAAEDLDEKAPQLASVVRAFADRLDGYATDLKDQSADQLVSTLSNYTRRRPAVVFGLAAVVGFFALRTLKSAPASRAEPSSQNRMPQAGGFYG